ncbi:expressed protein [Arabidopsis lyrata subsp. lyrata]|uniref:Expressed protein n=1 Tax=Arabidopsis lyrata subsp. lyrata TaxID=81972 RepID=D7MXK1_ARALL|nr:expressed protein [Arabidopsis lyrata subsp. lyrata]
MQTRDLLEETNLKQRRLETRERSKSKESLRNETKRTRASEREMVRRRWV